MKKPTPRYVQTFEKVKLYGVYSLMGAMRGPDFPTHETILLKAVLTSRLRGIVLGVAGCPGLVTEFPVHDRDVSMIEKRLASLAGRMKEVDGKVRTAIEHFLTHLLWAIEETRHHEMWSGYSPRLLSALKKTLNYEE